MKILIVNADDFGRSQGVNRGVAMAHEGGIVTSASLMVRRSAASEAAAYALEHPDLSLGLHVDLGEWVYSDGRWDAVDVVPGPAAIEIRRQLARFHELTGREPTHLDSHQHVHREQPVASVLDELAEELGIPLRSRDAQVRYCGDFYGQTGTAEPLLEAISVTALVGLLALLPAGITELGCHPGIGTDHDVPYGSERFIEVRTLCDPGIRAALTSSGIDLWSFADLLQTRRLRSRLAGECDANN